MRLLLLLFALPSLLCGELPQPYLSLYHSTDFVLAEFARLAAAHPDVLTWTPPSASDDAGPAFALGVATFGRSRDAQNGHPTLLLVFGEHARELITADTALWLARVLTGAFKCQSLSLASRTHPPPGEASELDGWPEAAAAFAATQAIAGAASHASPSAWAAELLSRVTLVLVPVEVPSSRRAVETGAHCRRKTLREVDLNRNWAAAWRKGGHTGGDEYGGTAPFSEPQSAALRDLAVRLQPAAYANVHSGEWAMYVPWDHKTVRRLVLRPLSVDSRLRRRWRAGCPRTRGSCWRS